MSRVALCLTGMLMSMATALPFTAQAQGSGSEAAQPVQLQIVIARYQNEKRVSSLPFTLSTSSFVGSKANVRMGSNVAVPSTTLTPQGDNAKALASYSFQNVGTSIDVTTTSATAGRIGLNVTISETTLKPVDSGATLNVPGTNTYQSQNTVFVKDGETAQFTAATDRLSGEVVRIEVTAKFLK